MIIRTIAAFSLTAGTFAWAGGDACMAGKGDATAAVSTDAGSGCCADKSTQTVSVENAKPFAKLKTLVGRWEAKTADAGYPKAVAEYKLTAAGSTLVETMFPGTDHEMVNTYVVDGDRVLLTHYCASGNQPRMALVKNDSDVMKFEFVDATNLKSPDGSYMSDLELTLVGPDQIKQKWLSKAGGKDGPPIEIELFRTAPAAKTGDQN